MDPEPFLARLVRKLEHAGVDHMLTGSLAAVLYGLARSTVDIDVVVAPAWRPLAALLSDLPETEYYSDAEQARDAVRRRGQFNVIDLATGWKVDLVVRKDRDFSLEEFRRRRRAVVGGVELHVVSPEDAILSKLEWCAKSGSERQMRDATAVVEVQGRALDRDYIGRWARELGILALWEQIAGGG